jgi:zinc D-Ala-D-Ala carboxypeptidase
LKGARLDIAADLRAIGFPLPRSWTKKQLREAISDFQRGFAHWDLVIDGYAGPKTKRALDYCLKNGGRCSEHFTYREFASKGSSDTTIKVHRALVRGLEEYREEAGSTAILSGYRDDEHNDHVGGASNSQHLYGNGADVPPILWLGEVKALRRFSGIGIDSSGKVRHVDVRHLGPNTTGGTIDDPTIWRYA